MSPGGNFFCRPWCFAFMFYVAADTTPPAKTICPLKTLVSTERIMENRTVFSKSKVGEGMEKLGGVNRPIAM